MCYTAGCYRRSCCWASVFSFQAEDGIRAHCVTGVQTCALPIFWRQLLERAGQSIEHVIGQATFLVRSEERRVGKDGASRWAPNQEKKNEGAALLQDYPGGDYPPRRRYLAP